jgi:hypothetical protein
VSDYKMSDWSRIPNSVKTDSEGLSSLFHGALSPGVKLLERQADISPLSSGTVKSVWSTTSTFMARCLATEAI